MRIVLALLVLAALVVLAVVALGLDAWSRRRVEQALGDALGAQVRLAQLDVQPLALRAEFGGLHLEGRTPAAHWQVGIERGSLALSWGGLWGMRHGVYRLRDLRLTAPVVTIEEHPGGPHTQAAPQATGEPLDLRVERLEVRQGRLSYADRVTPLEFDARELRLDAAWSRDLRAMLGRVGFDADLRPPSFNAPLTARIEGALRYRGRRLELLGWSARAAGLDLGCDARLDWGPQAGLRGEGRARLDLQVLYPLVTGLPRLGGTADVDLAFQSEGGPLELQGTVAVDQPQVDRWSAERFSTHASYAQRRLRLTDVRVSDGSSRLEGTADWPVDDSAAARATLRLRDVPAPELLGLAGLKLPLASLVSGEAAIGGSPTQPGDWRVEGRFEMAPAGGRSARGVPVRARGTAGLDRGRVWVRAGDVQAGEAVFALSVDAALGEGSGPARLVIDGSSRSFAGTRAAALVLMRALAVEVPDWLQRPLTGGGELAASLVFDEVTALELRLGSGPGSFGELAYDELELELALDERQVDVRRVRLRHGEERLEGAVRLGLDDLRPREAEVVARAWELRSLAAVLGLEPLVDGRLDGRLSLEAAAEGLAGQGQVELHAIRYLGESLDRIVSRVEVRGERVELTGLEAEGPALTLRGRLLADLATGDGTLRVDQASLDLSRISRVREAALDLEGQVDFTGSLAREGGRLGGGAGLHGHGLQFRGYPIGETEGRVELHDDRAHLMLGQSGDSGLRADVSVGFDPPGTLDGELRFDDMTQELFAAGDAPWTARFSGAVRGGGPLGEPESWRLVGTVEHGEIHTGLSTLQLVEPLQVSLVDRRLIAEPLRLRGPYGELVGSWAQDVDGGDLRGALRGTLDLGFVNAIVPDVRAVGATRVELRVSGSFEQPDFRGSIDVDGGRLRFIGSPYKVDQLDLSFGFNGREAQSTRLQGVFAGGEFRGAGKVRFDRFSLEDYELALQASAIRLAWPEGFEGVSDASLRLSGDMARATLAGQVELIRGRYREEFDESAWPRQGGREYSTEETPELAQHLTLDLDVTAPGDVWVRNETAKLESSFDLHVGGTLEQPEITGRFILLEGGEIEFRNVKYTIISGSLDFIDPDQIDPYIQVLAQTTVSTYDVRLSIEGTPEHFEYTLTSNPALDQEAIIMLLATGRTPYDVSVAGGQPRYTGDLAANYFAGALTAPFEKQLQKVLGLDRIQIDPFLVEGEADPTTRVTVRKDVADDLAVVYSTDLGSEGRQLYKVEWQPRRRLSVSATEDSIGGLGADLGWRKRYWWKRTNQQAASSAERAAEPRPGSPVVRAIRLEGLPPESAAALRGRLPLAVGAPYRRSKMVEGVETLRRALIRQGRLMPEVSASPVEAGDGTVEVVYTVEAGPRIHVTFDGLSSKEERRLRRALEDRWADSFFDADFYEDSRELIREAFLERGYYTADVTYEVTPGSEGPAVRFAVDRGKQIRVSAVMIRGASVIEESRIRRQMLTRPSSIFSRRLLVPDVLREDTAAIRSLYLDHGLLDVRIGHPRIHLATEANTATVELQIDEGPIFTIASLEFSENLPFPQALLEEWAELREGQPFSRNTLLAAQGRLRAELDRRGYPDARVTSATEIAAPQVRVRFVIEPNGRKRLAEIVTVGNNATPPKVILREIDLQPGDWISRAALLRNQHALYKLRVFSSVRMSYMPLDPQGDSPDQRLEIRVREAQPLGFAVQAGADSETGGRINMALTHDNIGGRGRALSLQGYYSGRLRRFQVVGREPRLFGHRFPALASFSWEQEEEPAFVVRRRSSAIRVSHEFTPRWSGYARYNFQRVTVLEVADQAALAEQQLDNLRLGDIGGAVIYSTLDDPFRARRGSYLSVSANLFAEPLLSDENFVKTVHKFARFVPLPHGIGFAAALRVGLAFPLGSRTRIPLSERFFAGGSQTIRGFALDSLGPQEGGRAVGGDAMLLLNEELRIPLWRSLNLVTFVDVGNIYPESADLDLGDLREVAGLGLRLETPIGPLRFEYGWKLDRRAGETPGAFFVSIGPPF